MAKVVYTAKATVTGGRQLGHGVSDDGALDIQLRPPTDGGGTNPEQLFAVGYGACFEGALATVARRKRIDIGTTSVSSAVSLHSDEDGTFHIEVALEVELENVDTDLAVSLVAEAHQVCPYSKAISGNVDVALSANGAWVAGPRG